MAFQSMGSVRPRKTGAHGPRSDYDMENSICLAQYVRLTGPMKGAENFAAYLGRKVIQDAGWQLPCRVDMLYDPAEEKVAIVRIPGTNGKNRGFSLAPLKAKGPIQRARITTQTFDGFFWKDAGTKTLQPYNWTYDSFNDYIIIDLEPFKWME